MADATVVVQQAANGDRAIDNELVLNDVGAMVYRQKVSVANFPATVEISNDSGNPLPVRQFGAMSAVTSRVTSSATAVTLLAANGSRNQATIYNESTQVLYVKFGTGASATDYTLPIAGGGYYEFPVRYLGVVTGIWVSADGFAQMTEF